MRKETARKASIEVATVAMDLKEISLHTFTFPQLIFGWDYYAS